MKDNFFDYWLEELKQELKEPELFTHIDVHAGKIKIQEFNKITFEKQIVIILVESRESPIN